ncbi:hypothetical protein [Flagellimonas flava]|uniref:hypothetical protein n=1 Tax=Flagellimonas flava TaxID=570519 RepID=UPI003D647660
MKNTRKVGHVLLAAIFLFMASCKQQTKPSEAPEETHQEEAEPVKPPKGLISLEESKSLYDNYSRNRVALIQEFEAQRSPEEKFDPARYTSFDYATIKQYMAYIEQEAKGAKVDISSIRFYFANYPNEEKFPDGDKIVHPRQNSIFMVPTMKVDGEDYGFYIGEDGQAKLIKDAVGANKGMGSNEVKKDRAYAGFVPSAPNPVFQKGGSLNMNHGSSGPPPNNDF